jgi:hypothetical protein
VSQNLTIFTPSDGATSAHRTVATVALPRERSCCPRPDSQILGLKSVKKNIQKPCRNKLHTWHIFPYLYISIQILYISLHTQAKHDETKHAAPRNSTALWPQWPKEEPPLGSSMLKCWQRRYVANVAILETSWNLKYTQISPDSIRIHWILLNSMSLSWLFGFHHLSHSCDSQEV